MKVKGNKGDQSKPPAATAAAAAENVNDKDEVELKVVVKNEPEDSSNGMININDKTEMNTNNTDDSAENTETAKHEQDLTPVMTSSSDPAVTIVSVAIPESGVITNESILSQALNTHPPGTHLIVHLQEGHPNQVQMLVDGKITPVTNVAQVISQNATIAVPPPVKKVKMLPPQKKSQAQYGKELKGRHRRKHNSVAIDELTQLTGESFKSQLLNTSDIVKALDLAPPTKRVMEYTSTIDSDTLFAFPGRPHSSRAILDIFSRNLTPVLPVDKNKKRKQPPVVKVEEAFSADISRMVNIVKTIQDSPPDSLNHGYVVKVID